MKCIVILENLTTQEIEEIVAVINSILDRRLKSFQSDFNKSTLKLEKELPSQDVNTESAFDLAWTSGNNPGIFITHGN